MKHLILESNSDISKRLRIFIPFDLLQELLQKGFPDVMVEAIEKDIIKDGTHILETNDEVRITINIKDLIGLSGVSTLQSIAFIEISDKIVNRKEDISKIDILSQELEKIFPHIDFSIVSTWTIDQEKREVDEDMKGVFLEKDKWYLTDEAMNFIRGLEGRVRLEPFWDVKHWAIGYGHMLRSENEMGGKITQEQAEELFKSDLIKFEEDVKKAIHVPMTLNMYAACVSFAYNAGGYGFSSSETASLINQKKYKEAFLRWKTEKINLGTKYEKGLRKRRERESSLFMGDRNQNSV
jgi:lysozyme